MEKKQPMRNVDYSFQFHGAPKNPQLTVTRSRDVTTDELTNYMINGNLFGKDLLKELSSRERETFSWIFQQLAAELRRGR